MALKVLHSFVHASQQKVTSLTVCLAEDSVILTLSDKVDKIRVKLNLDELAGLSAAITAGREWSAFHSFEREGQRTETRLSYRDSFFNVDNGAKKIALKLTDNERAAFARVLGVAFDQLVLSRPQSP